MPTLLTQREKQVLNLLIKGLSNRQIATALNLSIGAVGAHCTHIYCKLGVTSRCEAVIWSYQGVNKPLVDTARLAC